MGSSNPNRRRSMSLSASPYASQSDTTSSSSPFTWNSNGGPKSYFLSRFKASNTTPPISPTSSTSTSLSSLPPIHGQKTVKRKPIVSAATSPVPISQKMFESGLGTQTEELTLLAENTTTKKKGSNNRGFVGSLFKKKPRSKSVEKKVVVARTVESTPLSTPPAEEPSPPPSKLLSNYKPQYHQYEVGERPSLASQQEITASSNDTAANKLRWSRKSSISNSIYSTFGSESLYENNNASCENTTAATSVTDIHDDKSLSEKKLPTSIDLAQIVANNVQTRNPARVVSTFEDQSTDGDEEESEDLQGEEFVDATGVSQEDIERERIEARLSKRLSGGHFGSAGGLMMSIMSPSDTPELRNQKRKSRPPPEDVVQSMINWKRQSGQALAKYLSEQQLKDKEIDAERNEDSTPLPPAVPKKDLAQIHNKQLPAVPQRVLHSNPEILLSPTKEEEDEKEAETNDDDDSAALTENDRPQEIESPSTIFDGNDPKECALRLWNEDESFVQQDRIAEWLGQSKPLNKATLVEYMEYFDFATMRLDSAFRKVCSKLYFRAEAQQIDRILEAFAKRYWHCNQQTIFGSADTVYAVVYSLLLLNTDLHVAQGSYTRMTRQAFVKNTMSTILAQQKADVNRTPRSANFMLAWEAHIEAYLKDMYVSVKNYQILQPLQNQQGEPNNDFLSPTPTISKRMSMMGGKRMIDIKRGLNTMIHKSTSARESMLFLDDPSPRKSTSSSSQNINTLNKSRRRGSISSAHSSTSAGGGEGATLSPKPSVSSNGALLSPNQSHMMSFMDTHAADLFANRPPYLKERVVMVKHLLKSANQKAKHREWRECLLVVGQGELKMYGLQSDSNNYSASSSTRRNMIRASSASFANLADSFSKNHSSFASNSSMMNLSTSYSGVPQGDSQRWAAYSQQIGSIQLNHTLANALPPPGYNRSRPHVFAIQEPNGGVYLFQATSQDQVNEWVFTCNYWAARQSKEPLQGGVSNIEYGWGSCLDDVILDLDAVESGEKITGKYFRDPDAVNISSWIPPAPTMVSSILNEVAHYENLEKYLVVLNQEINDHREIKKKIIVKFPHKSQNYSKVSSNWEAKSKYMLHEIIKYQNYCDVLEKSISMQREHKENEKTADSNDM